PGAGAGKTRQRGKDHHRRAAGSGGRSGRCRPHRSGGAVARDASMKCPTLLALSVAAMLAGCHPFQKYQPTIRYPSLPEVSGRETALDCEALEDALLKTDAVRWAMRQEGARLL